MVKIRRAKGKADGASSPNKIAWIATLGISKYQMTVKRLDNSLYLCYVYSIGMASSRGWEGVFYPEARRKSLAGKTFECYFADLNQKQSEVSPVFAGIASYSSSGWIMRNEVTTFTALQNESFCSYNIPLNATETNKGGKCFKFDLTFPSDISGSSYNILVANDTSKTLYSNVYVSAILIVYEK